jgi:hypothetical protein
MVQVTIGLQAVGLGCLVHAEKGGTGCGTIRVAGKKAVFFLTTTKGAEKIFDPVIIRP